MQDQSVGRIAPGMDICDRNGGKVGTVAHVYRYDPTVISVAGGRSNLAQYEVVEVKIGFFGLGQRLYIPNGFIQEVTEGRVVLSKAADEVRRKEELHSKPSFLDDLY